jgi:hypothetical protein
MVLLWHSWWFEVLYHEIKRVSKLGTFTLRVKPPLSTVIAKQPFSHEFLRCRNRTVKLETSSYQVVGHLFSGDDTSFAVTASCKMLHKLQRRDDVRQLPGRLQVSR